jgi:hypothetical protein
LEAVLDLDVIAPQHSVCCIAHLPALWSSPEEIGIEGIIMRSRYAIAIVAVILIGFGVKLFFFSAPTAEAGTHDFQVCSVGSCGR